MAANSKRELSVKPKLNEGIATRAMEKQKNISPAPAFHSKDGVAYSFLKN